MPEQEGLRLDTFLSQYFCSRSRAEKIIKQSHVVKRNNNISINSCSYRVKAGECYYIHLPVQEDSSVYELKPCNYPIPIIFEDEYLLIVNKPSGIVTHPGPGA